MIIDTRFFHEERHQSSQTLIADGFDFWRIAHACYTTRMIDLQTTYLSVSATRRVDRLAADRYHMPSIVLMENAARSAMDAITPAFPPDRFPRVAVLVGGGNNGGDGLALARLMHNAGRTVTLLFATDPARLDGDAAINRDIAAAMNLPATNLRLHDDTIDLALAADALHACDLAIDAMLGTGLKDAVRPPLAALIELLNDQPDLPVVAMDVPSGFDADEGMPAGQGEGAAVIAQLTVTFAANKRGYRQPGAQAFTGCVRVGAIGVPVELIAELANP